MLWLEVLLLCKVGRAVVTGFDCVLCGSRGVSMIVLTYSTVVRQSVEKYENYKKIRFLKFNVGKKEGNIKILLFLYLRDK